MHFGDIIGVKLMRYRLLIDKAIDGVRVMIVGQKLSGIELLVTSRHSLGDLGRQRPGQALRPVE